MSSNFVRLQEILNQAFAENVICLTDGESHQKTISSFPNRDPPFFRKIWTFFENLEN